MEKTDFNKEWLVREIAKRASFSLSDIRIILDVFREIIEDVVRERKSLIFSGLFRLSIKKRSSHKGWNISEKKIVEVGESEAIIFKPSRTLLKVLKK